MEFSPEYLYDLINKQEVNEANPHIISLINDGHFSTALNVADYMLTVDKNNVLLLNNKAHCMIALHSGEHPSDLDIAEYIVKKAISIESTQPKFYITLAEIYLKMGTINEAILTLNKLVSNVPAIYLTSSIRQEVVDLLVTKNWKGADLFLLDDLINTST